MASTQERKPIPGVGLVKGLAVTMKHLLHRSVTQQYPHEKPDLPARTRGVIALKEANCTVCYKCSRACPDWCIYIDAHKETHEPASGGKARSAKILDRFAIDYSLCMYCGICVEVCPFDALFWSPEYEYAEFDVHELVHEKERLEAWTLTVLPPAELEGGAEVPAEAASGGAGAPAPEAESLEPSSANAPAPAPPAAAAATSAPATAAAGPKVEVALDQAVYEETLAAELAKGTPERVAIGKAKRAAMLAAKKSASAGGGAGALAPEAKGLEPSSANAPAPTAASSGPKVEVEPDQAVYDETLAAELAKGTAERVAIGKAKRAAMMAAKKAAAAASAATSGESLEPSSAPAAAPGASTDGGGAPEEPGSRPLAGGSGAPPPPPPPPPQGKVEVEPDQGVYDETLAAELAKGTPERVAIGKAKRAAMLAARKKAQG